MSIGVRIDEQPPSGGLLNPLAFEQANVREFY